MTGELAAEAEDDLTADSSFVGGGGKQRGVGLSAARAAGWLRRVSGWFYERPAQRQRGLAQRLQELDAAVGDAPDSLAHRILRGELLLRSGEYDLARADFEAALELAERFDPSKGWGLVEQVMRDRALRGLDEVRRRLSAVHNQGRV